MEYLNEKSYPLNKSNSKHVSIGLSVNLKPSITISGVKQKVELNEDDWKRFICYQSMLTTYFDGSDSGADSKWVPVIDSFTIEFQNFKNKKLIKLYKDKDVWVYLGVESVTGLWGLINLINVYLSLLHKQTFDIYYSNIINNNKLSLVENVANISNFVNVDTDGTNAHTLMEIIHFFPQKIILDMEVANVNKL